MVSQYLNCQRYLSKGTYSELARAPETFNDAEVVDGHRGEEKLCRIGVACLPDKESPELLVAR